MRLPAVIDVSAYQRCMDDFLFESKIRTTPICQGGFNQLTTWKPRCIAWPMQATFAHHGGKVWDIAFQQFIDLGIDGRRVARRHGDVRGHFLQQFEGTLPCRFRVMQRYGMPWHSTDLAVDLRRTQHPADEAVLKLSQAWP